MSLKRFFSAVCFCFLTISAFAFDWGGLLGSDSKFKTNANNDFKFDQKNTASAWIKVPANKSGSNYFVGEVTYQFEDDRNDSEIRNYFDLDLFKVVFTDENESRAVEVDIGRFASADLTGIIYFQNGDGVSLKYRQQGFTLSGYVGYTGFLNGNFVKIITASSYEGADSGRLYDFADKYVVANAAVSFPQLFANQTLSLQLFGSTRLTKEWYNRFYVTADFVGPISSVVFYRVDSSISFRQFDDGDVKLGNLSIASISSFFTSFLSATVRMTFASKNFEGFTHNPAMYSYNEPEYTDILKGGLAINLKPVNNILLSFSSDTAFELDTMSPAGIQYKISGTWQVFSDFSLNATFQHFDDLNNTDIGKTVIQFIATLTF